MHSRKRMYIAKKTYGIVDVYDLYDGIWRVGVIPEVLNFIGDGQNEFWYTFEKSEYPNAPNAVSFALNDIRQMLEKSNE